MTTSTNRVLALLLALMIGTACFETKAHCNMASLQAPDNTEKAKKEAEKYFQKGEKQKEKGEYSEAFLLFEKAANLGHATAQRNLGEMYYYGHGVTQDTRKAYSLFEQSAKQGYKAAQDRLELIDLAKKVVVGMSKSTNKSGK